MINNHFVLLFVISALSFSAPTLASKDADTLSTEHKASDSAEVKLNPWTDCGIGATLFSESKWAAVSSNITTATTSAVSSRHTCEDQKVAAAMLINNSYANLEEETAIGAGEHLTAMLNLVGCDSAMHNRIVQSIRTDFSQVVADSSYAEKSESDKAQQYYSILDNQISGKFASRCKVI